MDKLSVEDFVKISLTEDLLNSVFDNLFDPNPVMIFDYEIQNFVKFVVDKITYLGSRLIDENYFTASQVEEFASPKIKEWFNLRMEKSAQEFGEKMKKRFEKFADKLEIRHVDVNKLNIEDFSNELANLCKRYKVNLEGEITQKTDTYEISVFGEWPIVNYENMVEVYKKSPSTLIYEKVGDVEE